MADNVSIKDAADGTAVIATDDIGSGVQVQYMKIMDATDGGTNKASVSAAGELSVARNDAVNSASLAAANAAVTLACNGDASAFVQCTGTHVGTQTFEGTVDGTNWFALNGVVPTTGALVTTFTANGQWALDVAGLASFRVRRSTHTSGTAVVSIRLSVGTALVGFDQALPVGSNTIGYVGVTGGVEVRGVNAVGGIASGNPVPAGFRAQTANPTAVGNGQAIYGMTDKLGRSVNVGAHVRDMCAGQATTITSSTAATTVVTAGGANIFNDITAFVVTNGSATATAVTLSDGTVNYVYNVPAGGGVQQTFMTPRKATTANVAWTLTCGASVASIYCNVDFVKNL